MYLCQTFTGFEHHIDFYSISDWSVKWAAKRNNGIYEPEFRLFLLVPMFILDIAGYIGWVILLSYPNRTSLNYFHHKAVMQPKGLPWSEPDIYPNFTLMYSEHNS